MKPEDYIGKYVFRFDKTFLITRVDHVNAFHVVFDILLWGNQFDGEQTSWIIENRDERLDEWLDVCGYSVYDTKEEMLAAHPEDELVIKCAMD